MTLGEFLKETRLNKGHTQTQASEKIGISQTAYSFIETGRAKPRLRTLVRIGLYTKKPVSWLRKNLQ